MDTIHLPLVRPHIPITVAINVLRDSHRSALAVENGDDYRLLFWRHLLEAQARQFKLVSEIQDGYHVQLLGGADAQSYALDLVRPMRTTLEYMHFFAAQPSVVDYALVGATNEAALIVTRSEKLAALLAFSTGGFQCNGPTTHYFPDPSVDVGETCPWYPDKCQLASGGEPKISAI